MEEETDKFFCLFISPTQVEYLKVNDFKELNVNDMLIKFTIADSFISLQLPFQRKTLKKSQYPLQEFKSLYLNEKPKYNLPLPPYYLLVTPIIKGIVDYISVKIKSNIADLEFPLMNVPIKPEHDIKQFTESCRVIFPFFDSTQDSRVLVNDQELQLIGQLFGSNSIVFQCTIPENHAKKFKGRLYPLREFIDTEEKYINDLTVIDTYYQAEISKLNVFESQDLRRMFLDIPKIKTVHEEFLGLLRSVPITYSMIFANHFLNFSKNFLISQAFISNYNQNEKLVNDKRLTRSVDTKIKEIEKKSPNGKNFLQVYSAVYKRYPLYGIMLREIEKNTYAFHPDKDFLIAAQAKATALNKSLNEISRRVKYYQIFSHVSSFHKEFASFHNNGELIYECQVQLPGWSRGKGLFYMFNDCFSY